jgi:hypothetical protein
MNAAKAFNNEVPLPPFHVWDYYYTDLPLEGSQFHYTSNPPKETTPPEDARAGATLEVTTQDDLAPIQVVWTQDNNPHVDPLPHPIPGVAYPPGTVDDRPFYYAPGMTLQNGQTIGNDCKSTWFVDTAGQPLWTLAQQALSSPNSTYTASFRAEVHWANWDDSGYNTPGTIDTYMSNIGITWGYNLTVTYLGGKTETVPITVVASHDPNAKDAPVGFGSAHYVAADAVLPYSIEFENDPKQATVPAQSVHISDPLDPNLDPSTFQLSSITFGNHTITVSPGLQYYTTTVDLRPDGQNLLVKITAGLDPTTDTTAGSRPRLLRQRRPRPAPNCGCPGTTERRRHECWREDWCPSRDNENATRRAAPGRPPAALLSRPLNVRGDPGKGCGKALRAVP